MEVITSGIKTLKLLNLFRDPKNIQETNALILRRQIITTRIYLVLLYVSLLILILFTAFSQKLITDTISKPSLVTYEHLRAKYPNTLSCPCENIAISHEDFLSITVNYHQVEI